MTHQKLLGLIICLTALFDLPNSYAGQASANANYQLTLASACTITATGANFGTFAAGSANKTGLGAGSVDVTCPSGTVYRWGFSGGVAYSFDGAIGQNLHHLVNGGNKIPYMIKHNGAQIGDNNLSAIDPSYTTTATASNGVSGTGTGAPQTYSLTANVYLSGTIAFPLGVYNDTLVATVVW